MLIDKNGKPQPGINGSPENKPLVRNFVISFATFSDGYVEVDGGSKDPIGAHEILGAFEYLGEKLRKQIVILPVTDKKG